MKEMISQLAEISKKVSGKRSIINNITIDSVGLIKIEFDITKKNLPEVQKLLKKAGALQYAAVIKDNIEITII